VETVQEGSPSFEYDLKMLPPGRVPFRRWRWELWHGALLLASGWRTAPREAERALRAEASRRAHELRGLRALRPDRAHALDHFSPGAIVRLDCGAVSCVLAPRAEPRAAAA
jgi:hypothetical protein